MTWPDAEALTGKRYAKWRKSSAPQLIKIGTGGPAVGGPIRIGKISPALKLSDFWHRDSRKTTGVAGRRGGRPAG